jgi:hypothetical protein
MSFVSIAVEPNADASPLDAVLDMGLGAVSSARGADDVPDTVSSVGGTAISGASGACVCKPESGKTSCAFRAIPG